MQELQDSNTTIAIVDDESSVRKGLERLIRSVGWKTESWTDAGGPSPVDDRAFEGR